MKKTAFTLLLFLVGIIAQAQIPNGYYDNATGKTGDELKTALHDIITGHTSISYQQIWSAFWSTDNKGNNVVWDMYSDGANYTYNYYSGNSNDQCGEYDSEGDCFNREHSWPQSWFNNASTPTTDLHHIFPTDGFVNSQRSNFPFGEVQSASWTSQNGSKLGTCKSSLGYSGTVFEPIDEYKGDFARALMYMSVRYYSEDNDWGTSGMTNKSLIKDWAINMLMNWSDNDPVSQKEIDRNNVVYGIQNNRNPFIDHPEYARAIWDPNWHGVEYNISYVSVEHGSVSGPTKAVEGELITLTVTPDQNYELDALTVTDSDSHIISVTENQFEMPASDVTVSANFTPKEPSTAHYYLVTSTDQLEAGRTYLIVNTSASKALGTTQNNNNRAATNVTISGNIISSIGDNVCKLSLGGSTNAWTFFDANWGNNGGYLYAASSSKNHLKTQATNNANGQWTISIDSEGTATIVAIGSNTRNDLRFNPNGTNPIFSCYASSSELAKVELYILSETREHTESATLSHINTFDQHTILSGATLTVNTVYGTEICNSASNLIIEDGAQLIHHTDGIKATTKKNIAAYSSEGGWYSIATPFANYNPSEITTNSYDLYAYTESAEQEWRNYKSSSFNMTSGCGYLYAHNPSTTLHMTGSLTNGDYSPTIDLSYGNSDANLKGFNLLGNPTAHDITFTTTEAVSDGYYYLSNHEDWVYSTNNNVPVGRGFLVKANAEGQNVTLNPQSKDESLVKEQFISLDIDGDKAYVKMTEGVSMPLLNFRGKSSSVYLTRDGQAYTMLIRDNAESIDLCYRPIRHGQHTLSVTANGVDYLHLIDHRTGADIDLIANPSYLFESTNSDYSSRFQLRFSPDSNSDSDLFAYYADGHIVVNGEGTLLIYDIAGRKVENSHLTPGVYILRLTTPERVRVQKLIID